jgi:hypothetical protein
MDIDAGQRLYRLDKSPIWLFLIYGITVCLVIAILVSLYVIVQQSAYHFDYTASFQGVMSILVVILVCLVIYIIKWGDPKLFELYQKGIIVTERREGREPLEITSVKLQRVLPDGRRRLFERYLHLEDLERIDFYTDWTLAENLFSGGIIVFRIKDGSWVSVDVQTANEPPLEALKNAYGPGMVYQKELGPKSEESPKRKPVTIKFDGTGEPPECK